METRRRGNVETWRHGEVQTCRLWRHEDMDIDTSNGKWKPRQFSLIRLLVAHRENWSFIRLLTKKERKTC
jgi:hypothetical protein